MELEIEQRQQAEKMSRPERDLNLTLLKNSPNFLVAIDPESKTIGMNLSEEYLLVEQAFPPIPPRVNFLVGWALIARP
ncbi:MAG: hypothetical protein WBL95_25075 [Microcoleus sp.]